MSLADPQTLNLYAYCANDPINHTDPNGLFLGAVLGFVGRFFAGLFGGPGGSNLSGSFTYGNLEPISVSFTNSFTDMYVGYGGINFQVRRAQPNNPDRLNLFNAFKDALEALRNRAGCRVCTVRVSTLRNC